jgi:pumilio family protein 6
MVLENLVETVGKSKLPDYIANPKGSRQFQQFIKLGTKEHRNGAIDALAKLVPDLAMRNIYALITLEKIVTYGLKSDETHTSDILLKPVMTERKIVEKLLFHRLGCKFLNKLFLHPAIKPALKKQMMQIIQVPRAIEVLGESKEKLRQYYLETAKKCIDKELLGFEIVQKLLKEAVTDFADDQPFNEELLGMAADGLPHLLSSRDGVHVVVKLLGLASAKHKKNFIKELKGKFAEMAKNTVTSVVLLRILECVDDTVLVGKSVLSELIGSDYTVGKDLLLDVSGRMPLLYALEGLEMKSGRCFYQPDRQLLASNPCPTALKEKSVRCSEISSKLIPSVLKIVKSNINEFVVSEAGKDVVIALARALKDDAELPSFIAEIMAVEGEFEQTQVTCFNTILKERISSNAGKLCWSHILAKHQSVESIAEICRGLGSFVLMNLLKDDAVAASVRGAIKPSAEALKTGETNKGTELILMELEGPVMSWEETLKTFAVERKRKETVSTSQPAEKKLKTSNELFADDDEDEEDEMWGIVGDDDEFLEE